MIRTMGGPRVGAVIGIGALAALAAGALLLGRGEPAPDLPVYWDAPEFELLDQRADTLRPADLRGTPWVASFVFTSCTGVCPTITERIAALRDRLREEGALGTDVRLVSFSVDPERDTPEVLRSYAERYGDPAPSEWAFLTGDDGPAVRRMVQEGFRLTASAPPVEPHEAHETAEAHEPAGPSPGGYQIMHSPRIVLVDAEGAVRGTYDATEPGVVERIVRDLRTLGA